MLDCGGNDMGQFPFGAPVLPRGNEVPGRKYPVLLLGAYPSALHVRWTPPEGFGRPVTAFPVDNEPSPFWAGDQAETLFAQWHERFFDARWGVATPAALNGSSGRDIERDWLRPLGFTRNDAFITDCLPTARASSGVAKRLADRYAPVVEALGAPLADLGPHPTETQIVNEALRDQRDRLTDQLAAASPEVIVTLGNAAARVIAGLGEQQADAILRAETYGGERRVTVGGRSFRWLALVHPATPPVWMERHQAWISAAEGPSRPACE